MMYYAVALVMLCICMHIQSDDNDDAESDSAFLRFVHFCDLSSLYMVFSFSDLRVVYLYASDNDFSLLSRPKDFQIIVWPAPLCELIARRSLFLWLSLNSPRVPTLWRENRKTSFSGLLTFSGIYPNKCNMKYNFIRISEFVSTTSLFWQYIILYCCCVIVARFLGMLIYSICLKQLRTAGVRDYILCTLYYLHDTY